MRLEDEPLGATDVWGEYAKRYSQQPPLGWLDTPWVLQKRVFPMVFGREIVHWWTIEAMEALEVPLGGRWLDLGCGGGGAEIEMSKRGLFTSMVAVDPSPGAIEIAREQMFSQEVTNIDFRISDINEIELPESEFDVVHINMALHHCSELEWVLYQINRSLKDGGVFLANEFVGPSQFQFSDKRMGQVERSLALLPERLRWNPIGREAKTRQPRYDRDYWDRFDPTEAVRSDAIPTLLRNNFPTHRRIDYGGNLLNLVLENIALNFDPDRSEDTDYIEILFAEEDEVLAHEPSDFAYFVCPKGDKDALQTGEALAARRSRRRFPELVELAAGEIDPYTVLHSFEAIETNSSRIVLGPLVREAKKVVRRSLRFYLSASIQEQAEFQQSVLAYLAQVLVDCRRQVDDLSKLESELVEESGRLEQLVTRHTQHPSD